ncbi:MAG: aspartyl protease family protein [Planctomycetota bacterium]
MGRIVTNIVVSNVAHPEQRIETSAMVDTGAAYLTLPMAWRDQLGVFPKNKPITVELANQTTTDGLVCAPVRIDIEGFDEVYTEALFVEMEPRDGQYETLLGYLPLETAQVAVDMLGHRLVPVKHADLK